MSNNEIREKVLDVIKTCIRIEISPEQFGEDLTIMGVDSVLFIQIVVALEDNFEIEIPDEKLLLTEMNTVSKMVDVISAVCRETYPDDAIGE